MLLVWFAAADCCWLTGCAARPLCEQSGSRWSALRAVRIALERFARSPDYAGALCAQSGLRWSALRAVRITLERFARSPGYAGAHCEQSGLRWSALRSVRIISGSGEVGSGFLGHIDVANSTDSLPRTGHGALGGLAQWRPILAKARLDRCDVGTVGRQQQAGCAGCCHRLADAPGLVAAGVVRDGGFARREREDEESFGIRLERNAPDRCRRSQVTTVRFGSPPHSVQEPS